MRRSFYLANASTSNFVGTIKVCCCALQSVRHLNNSINQHHICNHKARAYCLGAIDSTQLSLNTLEQDKTLEKIPAAKDKVVNDNDFNRKVYLSDKKREEIYDEKSYDEQEILKNIDFFSPYWYPFLEDSAYLRTVTELRNVFIDALFEDAKRYCKGELPGEIPETRDQIKSEVWRAERSIRFPASMAKYFLRLQQTFYAEALREHLWNLLPAINSKYGIEMEKKALQDYIKWAQAQDETTVVQETGMWINPAFPQLSCSPDGIVTSENSPPKLLEIKCPYVLKNCNVADFGNCTSGKGSDWLKRNLDHSLSLNRDSPSWFQIQVSMGILNFAESHFLVWSPYGYIVTTVTFDQDWWEYNKKKLIQLHAELWIPEYFLMRIPRSLRPLRIPIEE